MQTVGCTVTTSDLLPEALLLGRSFIDHHPDSLFSIVCLDRPWALRAFAHLPAPGVEIIAASSLPGVPPLRRLLFEWAPPGPLRAASASCIQGVFRLHPEAEAVVALAPWTFVHAPLAAESLLRDGAEWAVTKRMTKAFPVSGPSISASPKHEPPPLAALFRPADDGLHERGSGSDLTVEVDVLLGSTLSPDLGVFHRDATSGVLAWLEDRLIGMTSRSATWRVGIDDPELLERVLDVAASLFEPCVLTDAGLDVAPWNLGERSLKHFPDGSLGPSGGRLRTTNHFGYDHDRPWTARREQSTRAPWDLNDFPAARELWNEYGRSLTSIRSSAEFPAAPEGFSVAPGTPFSAHGRYALRAQANRSRFAPGTAEPASAFEDELASGAERVAWLRADTVQRGHLLGPDESRVIHRLGNDEPLFAPRTDPESPGRDAVRIAEGERSPHGVDVLGHLRSVSGLGEAGRRLLHLLQRSGIPTTSNNLPMSSNPSRLDIPTDGEFRHAVLLAVLNGEYMEAARRLVGASSYDRRYVIGQWAWETESLPLEHRHGFAYVDEVWANSTYVRDIIDRVAPDHIPVLHVPAPVETPQIDQSLDRAAFGLDDRTVFLFLFDHLSTIGRKNPVGTIEAYREAFAENDGAQLVMKSINASRSRETFEEVRWAAAGRKDIILADAFLSRTETNTLMSLCDVYVSLHRSEGLGFTMAEAMLLGRPVIASAYGGNLDFMDETSAVLVPTTRGRAERDYPPYLKGSEWAEPDLGFAATAMRGLAQDTEGRSKLGSRAAVHASAYFDADRCAEIVKNRLEQILGTIGVLR